MAGGWAHASVGTLVAFTTMQTRLFFPVGSLLSVQADVQSSLALFDRIFEYLDLPVDISERENAIDLPRESVRGEVRLESVSFAYEPDRPVLQDVSFAAEPGSKVAIVGETGSGKTTLGYLIARLYDVSEGAVLLDGTDVRDLSFAALRRIVGVVSQDTYLFHGTVRENLRFARPDATDEQLEQAATAARIHDHLASLPDGYDTIVGERGYRFSGGEKQRLAIARAILRDPAVLVLDEATSALDVETERLVQQALDGLVAGRTTIVIAHRLSTIRDSDLILVLDHGRIARARHARGAARTRRPLRAARRARRRHRRLDALAGRRAAAPPESFDSLLDTFGRAIAPCGSERATSPVSQAMKPFPNFGAAFSWSEERRQRMSPEELKLAIDTVWVIVAGCMVFLMQAGFAMLEVGFSRGKNVGAVVAKILVNLSIGTIAFWAVGFALAFGNGNKVLGTDGFFLHSSTFSSLSFSDVPLSAKFLFEVVFCTVSLAIVWGTMLDRTKFGVYIIFAIVFAALIYPLVGHWIWGGGFLAQRGMQDFAGSTVVHLCGARRRSPARSCSALA